MAKHDQIAHRIWLSVSSGTNTSLTFIRLVGELKVQSLKPEQQQKQQWWELQLQTYVHRAKSFHNVFFFFICLLSRRQPATACCVHTLDFLSLPLTCTLRNAHHCAVCLCTLWTQRNVTRSFRSDFVGISNRISRILKLYVVHAHFVLTTFIYLTYTNVRLHVKSRIVFFEIGWLFFVAELTHTLISFRFNPTPCSVWCFRYFCPVPTRFADSSVLCADAQRSLRRSRCRLSLSTWICGNKIDKTETAHHHLENWSRTKHMCFLPQTEFCAWTYFNIQIIFKYIQVPHFLSLFFCIQLSSLIKNRWIELTVEHSVENLCWERKVFKSN